MTTLAEIVDRHGGAYVEKYGTQLLPSHHQALRAIVQCRTAALGGHVYRCGACEKEEYRYHSCRNRHCPQCQGSAGQAWLEKQQRFRLPVPYFLVTFTLPEGLGRVGRRHQKELYNLLFRTSAAALQELCADRRHVGGQVGMVGVLHTWGRQLSYHPHVHYVVAGVGVGPEGQTRVVRRSTYLVPVKALSRLFRGKFRAGLRRMGWYGEVPEKVWRQAWVVHSKSVGDGRAALQYLAPYIFRVALGNGRLVKLHGGQVTFRYRETESGKMKTCRLGVEEFLRRFLQHILPKGFVKVRYYGLFSAGKRQEMAALRAEMAGAADLEGAVETEGQQACAAERMRVDFACRQCGQAMMRGPRVAARPP